MNLHGTRDNSFASSGPTGPYWGFPGRGCPASTETGPWQQRAEGASNEQAPASAGIPWVLVVEDDEVVGKVIETGLRAHGFNVVLARSGAEALDVFGRHQDDLGLAVLDVQMPGLSGPQTLTALLQLRPGLQACFVTGFAGSYGQEELLQAGARCVFAKPFRMAEVADFLWQLHREQSGDSAHGEDDFV